MELNVLILAAGKGTRMKSTIPKVLHTVCGKPMLQKIIEVSMKLTSEKPIVVLGYQKEKIIEQFKDIRYVVQKEQLGTGNAVIEAMNSLKGYSGTLMIVCGDTPLLKEGTLRKLYEFHKKEKAITTILTSIVENPFGYGRIVKNNNEVIAIVEEKEATEEEKKITEVNTGVYCFEIEELEKALSKIDNNNEKGEYYLTDVISINVKEGKKVRSFILEDNKEILGVNSKIELEEANSQMRDRINKKHMENGVILIDSKNVYIEEDVEIGEDTIIYPNVVIQGKTKIGKACSILSGTRIIDSEILNNVRIESSVIEESKIEENVTVGPFAHLRSNSHLKKNVHIGNFVEIKKSILNDGVKVGHLTYLGDSIVGEKTNIGAGTITCNYDGKNKNKTKIGRNAFIGSDTIIVAPIDIGDNATTAAGSVITKDVPDNALGIERNKQSIKQNWRK